MFTMAQYNKEQKVCSIGGIQVGGVKGEVARDIGGVGAGAHTPGSGRTVAQQAGGIFKKGGAWMEDNPVKTMIIGQGLTGTMQAIREDAARRRALEEERSQGQWGANAKGEVVRPWGPPQTSDPLDLGTVDPNLGKTKTTEEAYSNMRSGVLAKMRNT